MLNMERRLNEFERAILLAFLTLSKGEKFVRKEEILMKFPRQQRKFADRMIERLAKEKYLLKHHTGKSFMISESGKKAAFRVLVEGGRFLK